MKTMMRLGMACLFAGALAVGVPSATVQAQGGPVIGGGLVNVQVGEITVEDIHILEDVTVGLGVAANIAANVCGTSVNVGVLARILAAGQEFTCQTGSQVNDRVVTITQ